MDARPCTYAHCPVHYNDKGMCIRTPCKGSALQHSTTIYSTHTRIVLGAVHQRATHGHTGPSGSLIQFGYHRTVSSL